jgi:L-glutamine-phosphate cytidylyltransferase
MLKNAIILAAGSGARLKPITDHAPKCLTEVNRTPILTNALEALQRAGVERCVIVTGYMSDAVESAAAGFSAAAGVRRSFEIRCVHNGSYAKTNDMFSLWLARDVLERGAIVLEGDVFFRPGILSAADRAMGDKSHYFVGSYNGKENEIVIKTASDGRVTSIEVLRGGASRPSGKGSFMSSGMIVVRRPLGLSLSRWLTEHVERNDVNVLFDDVLAARAAEIDLHLFEIGHDEWVEIDTPQDLSRAERTFTDRSSP